jgi:hypothetical protein
MMVEASPPVSTNRTLGDLPGQYQLHFNCTDAPACHFNKPVDINLLIDRLGDSFECADLYGALRCPACKGRKFLVICTPVHHSYGNTAHERS